MTVPYTDSWLGEAFASYQPSSMPTATWQARFRDDAAVLVAKLDLRDEREVRRCLSRLAVFLADFVEVRPQATLADLLTREHVDGHLERALESGAAPGTVQNRQGTLNALLRARAGRRQHDRRGSEQHLAPYSFDELGHVLDAATTDGSAEATALARTILCGLAGATPPTRRRSTSVRVEVTGDKVVTDRGTYTHRGTSLLPSSGELDAAEVERARQWGREVLGFSLDVRRLALTQLTSVVRDRPALEVLKMPGVGRDRLTAALQAAAVDGESEGVRRLLRFPGATTDECG